MTNNQVTHDSEDVDTIHEYSPISVWNSPTVRGSLRVRIVRRKGREYLDIREFHKGQSFEGWTRRGLRFSLSELRVLEDIITDAKSRLDSETSKDNKQWPESPDATDVEQEGHVST